MSVYLQKINSICKEIDQFEIKAPNNTAEKNIKKLDKIIIEIRDIMPGSATDHYVWPKVVGATNRVLALHQKFVAETATAKALEKIKNIMKIEV